MINVSIPQIPVPDASAQGFYENIYVALPLSNRYGNLSLKFLDYRERHDYMNSIIRDIYLDHTLNKAQRNNNWYSIKETHFRVRNNTETVIYWMRKTADDLIGLIYYMEQIKTNNSEPDKIKIASIGSLLNSNSSIKNTLEGFLIFLDYLNSLSNAYKHSISHTDIHHLIGKDEPTVIALELKYNDAHKHSNKFLNSSLREIIEGYSNFFVIARDILVSYSHIGIQE